MELYVPVGGLIPHSRQSVLDSKECLPCDTLRLFR